ncbi:MAG: hypothetical protein SFY80_12930 [Verrucomicrobiota bacterium]|nr:hypothetical protein [Verrucomicrobiota bacterium]
MASLKWILSYACGYAELGMYEEAKHELASIEEAELENPAVLETKVYVYGVMKEWVSMETYAITLCEKSPDNEGAWIHLAYARRRARSITEARMVLLGAVARFPENATIHYNLACYAAQLDDLCEARKCFDTCIALNPLFIIEALKDDDLEPLWPEVAELKAKLPSKK